MAILLLLNHSLMFGVAEAAHIPDDEHPYGHIMDYDHETIPAGHSVDDGHESHEQHHKHGMHVHLNCDLPYTLSFEFETPGSESFDARQFLHPSLAYSPPVPPPNR